MKGNDLTVSISGKMHLSEPSIEAHFLEHDFGDNKHAMLAGNILSHEIGDTYVDHTEMSPAEQWTRIVEALEYHGFEVSIEEQK